MDRAGLFSGLERADRAVRGKSGASIEIDRRADAGGGGGLGFVQGRGTRRDRQEGLCYIRAKAPAFRAALVSPPVFLVLPWRIGEARASRDAPLARHNADPISSLHHM